MLLPVGNVMTRIRISLNKRVSGCGTGLSILKPFKFRSILNMAGLSSGLTTQNR